MKSAKGSAREAKRGAAVRKAGGRPPARAARRKASALGKREGCAASVSVTERNGGVADHAEQACAFRFPGTGSGGGRGKGPRIAPHVCAAMAALGHAVRARLLVTLLEGPATYQTLRRAAKAEAGPLYHHIAQLRLAGLILPKQRDLYELTRAGRNLVLVAAALDPMVKDRRRRPVDAEA